ITEASSADIPYATVRSLAKSMHHVTVGHALVANPATALARLVPVSRVRYNSPQQFSTMRAMLLDVPRRPLRTADVPRPQPGPGQLLIAVNACGVCRTDLHIFDAELPKPKLPLVLRSEIH